MRIIAGKYKSKKLFAPEGKTTRPTSDRTREAVFNVLESYFRKKGISWADVNVLDAFSGTGALGLEALSRGAVSLTAAEKDSRATVCFWKNADVFVKGGSRIDLFADALLPPQAKKPVVLLFMDPPYAKGLIKPALEALEQKGWIDKNTLCVLETERHEKDILPDSFDITDMRFYGKSAVLFVQKKAVN